MFDMAGTPGAWTSRVSRAFGREETGLHHVMVAGERRCKLRISSYVAPAQPRAPISLKEVGASRLTVSGCLGARESCAFSVWPLRSSASAAFKSSINSMAASDGPAPVPSTGPVPTQEPT